MPGPPTFVISGRGWGHGVGMAQWGAYGFAQHGASYRDILAHYYRGTTLGPAPISKVRVYLAAGRAQLSLGSNAPYTVRDGIGQTWHIAAGTLTFGPKLKIKTTDVQQPQRLPEPLTFIPGGSPLRFGSTAYRGQLQVSLANGRLRAINLVGLEAYLYGVVPSEMPKDWLPEALKAQAVAARSYALAVRKTGSWFDLYPDTRSQVYLGIAHEAPSATAAVQATAGQVVLYGGKVATTYFFSSSGGRTASAPEVFPSAPATPYLVSVNDPYDTISPHHRWGPFVVSAQRLRRMLGVRGALSDVTLELGPSGRVETITGVGAQGSSTMKGWDFRRALGLDSTWFRVGVLSLGNPQAPITYGTRVLDRRDRSQHAVGPDRPPSAGRVVGGSALGHTRPGRVGRDQGQAEAPDRLPARQRLGAQPRRARVGRSARPLPRHAERLHASWLRTTGVPGRERGAPAQHRRQLEDGRAGDCRPERRLRGARHPDSG